MSKTYLLLFVVGGILVASSLGYFYYSQSQIKFLSADNARLTQIEEQYKVSVSELENVMRKQAQLLRTLNEDSIRAKLLANEALAAIEKHDLEFLSFAKPELIQKRINNATSKVFKDIENEINN
jgi:hypothetical protein